MSRDWLGMIRRGIRKPPKVIARRLSDEVRSELDRFVAPLRAKQLTGSRLVKAFGLQDIDALWDYLGKLPYAAQVENVNVGEYEKIFPGDAIRIINMAENAIHHEVNLLGSGPVKLGNKIDWHRDYKSNFRWAPAYIRSIEYNNPDQPSDVKFPWEVSRLQWTIPAGQAYLLNKDEKYAIAVKDILLQWIDENPYAFSVNWACTMEVALRILSWTWLFHVFKASPAWRDKEFREKFLCVLYLHGEFTTRHLERSDINGNHYTADATGLVFAGLFFGGSKSAKRWLNAGWKILTEELQLQVSSDGVDFEGSIAYHRLVLELFFLPALYCIRRDLKVHNEYKERLIAMANFTAAYTQPDGNSPLIGDADDARALPFSVQGINDHRYLLGLIGSQWGNNELIKSFSGPKSEIYWLLGEENVATLPDQEFPPPAKSVPFSESGYYILGHDKSHVFVDCAPLGLAGRGGHGHNDCLSFEAVLSGEKLISDCGAYLYTASYKDRNLFRSTAYHNTPRIDGEEINRYIRPDYLWNLHYDAHPSVLHYESSSSISSLRASHSGYERLPEPVSFYRDFILNHENNTLHIEDQFKGKGKHRIEIPLHLAPGVTIQELGDRWLRLISNSGGIYLLKWDASPFRLLIDQGRVSVSYGVLCEVVRIMFVYHGTLPISFCISLIPD
jgi:hypothetical protein